MREILNISLPKAMVQGIKKEVKERGFASVSEFVRAAIRVYHEEMLWRQVQQSQKEFAEGKGKTLRSLADLD